MSSHPQSASLNQARTIHAQTADSISPDTNPWPKPAGTTRRPSHDRSAPPMMRATKPLAMRELLSILLSA